MQHDEVIWQIINQGGDAGGGHCSFRVKQQNQNFCRNEYNVTGLCNRSSCPLMSQYATVREMDGKCFLFLKTIERAHSPKNLWEKIPLSRNYMRALAKIDAKLEFAPKFLKHKCKQRLTKIHQYLIRMRKLKLKVKPKLVGINKKVERREVRREAKALTAAKLENSIKTELLSRLKEGTYGDIYNFPQQPYQEIMDQKEEQEEDESESEVEFVEYNSDFESEAEIEDEVEREFEYEYEMEGGQQPQKQSSSSSSMAMRSKRHQMDSDSDEMPAKKARGPRARVDVTFEDDDE